MIEFSDYSILPSGAQSSKPLVSQLNLKIDHSNLVILGVSGSGKSTLIKALFGPLESDLRAEGIRKESGGLRIHKISQNPFSAFHPLKTLDWHLRETILSSGSRVLPDTSVNEIALRLLPNWNSLRNQHPYEVSGGELMRFSILVAASRKPHIILADEPTASLDSKTAEDVARLLKDVAMDISASLIVATHDLNLVELLSDQALVIHEGRIAYFGGSAGAISNYKTLWPVTQSYRGGNSEATQEKPLIEYDAVQLTYGRNRDPIIRNLDLLLCEGSRVLIEGNSGSGKSTILRSFFDSSISISGVSKFHFGRSQSNRAKGHHLGLVFQDTWSTLSPRRTVHETLVEGLTIGLRHGKEPIAVEAALEMAGLDQNSLFKRPSELSGGERQRVAFIRAVMARPKLLILDEPTSHLDPVNSQKLVNMLLQFVDSNTALILSSHKPNEFLELSLHRRRVSDRHLQQP